MLRAAFAIPGDLATPTGGYAYDREVLGRLSHHGVAVRHLALPSGFPFPDERALRETRARLQASATDEVLLVDGLALGALPPELVAGVAAPLVALVHHPLGHESGLDTTTSRTFIDNERAVLALVGHVVVTSPTTARVLTSEFDVLPSRITVAVPGTDKAARARGSAGGGPVQLLAVGAISRRKGYDVLIEALSTLQDRDWVLTIAGAADRAPDVAADIRDSIAASGLADRIRMLGSVDTATLAGLYAGADIFLMPSLYEGYGMVLAEAMARGLPIVCTTGGAAAETVPDDAGLKVPPGDAAAFATAAARLLDDAGLRRRLADASWAVGGRLPDWDDTTRIIAAVLRHVSTNGADAP